MAYQFEEPKDKVTGVPSIVGGNRLEPRTRSAEFNRSLRAEVRDAAWLLARQWQMKEFRAEDRGSPVAADITVEHAPLNQVKIGSKPVVPYADGLLPQPLDAMVQAQPPVMDWGMQLQLGAQWTRMLRRTTALTSPRIGAIVAAARQSYPLLPPADVAPYRLDYALAQTTPEALAVLQAVGPAALNGYQLLLAIANATTPAVGFSAFLSSIGGTASEQQALIAIARAFLAWYNRVYYQHGLVAQDLAAWSVEEMAYQFQAAAPTSAGIAVMEAREHLGEGLDWYTVDEVANAVGSGFSNSTAVTTASSMAVPTEIQFLGAPNARWWEFEDRQVDFGQLTGDSSDLGRMLLQEFMFLYHNDWFSVPYTIPTGSLCSVTKLTVTDVFGLRYVVEPAGNNQRTEAGSATKLDHDWGRWSLYALSQRDQRQTSQPRLLLPPTAVGTLAGPVLEQVYFAREEATNLVWGVEQLIPDQLGRGMDGNSAATRVTEYLRARAQPVTPLATVAKLEYKLSTPTVENWVPFVPLLVPDTANKKGFLALEQGEMLRQVDGLVLANNDLTIKPRTTLLAYPAVDYLMHERQVPPVGVRLEGNYRRTRWFNGATFTWYGRSRGTGRTGGSSGLAYDQLLPLEARTDAAHFAITAATYVTPAGALPELVSVRLREVDAAGNLLAAPRNATLQVTRAQLVSMLTAGDAFVIAYTTDAVGIATVGTATYIQRTPFGAAGDRFGTIPPPPPGSATSS
jgi:hypothetical protein